MTHLPDTLHELLSAALDDLAAVADTPGYAVDMANWHAYYPVDEICVVCLAGAVMVRRLDADRQTDLAPCDFSAQDRPKLMALDQARSGDWDDALTTFYDRLIFAPNKMPLIPAYLKAPDLFVERLREAAQILKKHNL